ncbi:MAG TPA: decaprenyl-phosphate phosphoribosyltransferase [Desulfobacteria bacterium]|nr:decaprenyl-phosphate phosphoribosyltransferase [Desulfobacteria bacterium]
MKLQTRIENAELPLSPVGAKRSVLFLLLKAMRPKQWTKNLVVFAGLIFSQKAFENGNFMLSLFTFFVFCLLSGSVYLINDLVDVQKDRAHPEKRKRPIASGDLSTSAAMTGAAAAALFSLAGAFVLHREFGLIALIYFLTTLGYTFKLKNVVLMDVIVIAIGFVFRALAGVVVINVNLSPWLLMCTFLLALFLALTKRRHELVLLDSNAISHRRILDEYTPAMLDQMISVATSSTVMAYSLYTFTSGHSVYLMATIPFVIYGIFRYQYLAHSRDIGGSPESALLKDWPMVVNILLWVSACLVILYLFE